MDFDRPWLKLGLVSEGGVLRAPKHLLRNALELPNQYQDDPERLYIRDARMRIIAKIWY